MNLSSAESKSPSALTAFLFSLLPPKAIPRSLILATCVAFLFTFDLLFAYSHQTALTPYLPAYTFVAVLATIRFRLTGLLFSYPLLTLVLYYFLPTFDSSERFYQIGICATLASTLFAVFCVTEEIAELVPEEKKQEALIQAHSQALEEKQKEADKREELLEEEIRKLTEEAELRRIEKVADLNRIELIQAQLEILKAQKDEALMTERTIHQQSVKELQKQHVEELRLLEETCRTLKQQAETKELQHNEALTQVQSALTMQLQALKSAKDEAEQLLDQHAHEIKAIQDTLIAAQEEILILQQKPAVTQEVTIQDPKLMGMYNQLRSQFQEKNEVLVRTRQELFALQGKLEVLEKEKAEAALDRQSDGFDSEFVSLMRQVVSLEEEIECLEQLISFQCL